MVYLVQVRFWLVSDIVSHLVAPKTSDYHLTRVHGVHLIDVAIDATVKDERNEQCLDLNFWNVQLLGDVWDPDTCVGANQTD